MSPAGACGGTGAQSANGKHIAGFCTVPLGPATRVRTPCLRSTVGRREPCPLVPGLAWQGGSQALGMPGHGGGRLLGTVSDRRGEASGRRLRWDRAPWGRKSHMGKRAEELPSGVSGAWASWPPVPRPRREGNGGVFLPYESAVEPDCHQPQRRSPGESAPAPVGL